MSFRRTLSATAGRTTCRPGRCSWSVAATPASRSRRSCRRRTRSRSRSVPARRRCRNACSGATSSGGSRRRGILDKTVDSRLGRKLSTRDTLIGSSPRELKKRYGVELRPRLVDADGHTVRFEDGSELEIDGIIWATGYRSDHSWIKLPIFDEDGRLRHRRGVTDLPGLYFLGLTWQYTRGSALIGWVKDDAEFIAERIAEYHDRGVLVRAHNGRRGSTFRSSFD